MLGARNTDRHQRRLRFGASLRLELLEPRLPLTAEIEPNNTPATATLLPANELIEGQILNVQDLDHFRVDLQSGDTLEIQTRNTQDALFNPTLPPPIDLLDGNGLVLATSRDGRNLEFTAPSSDSYYVRMTSENAFGTFTESYSMQSTLTPFSGVAEQEPNDTTNQASTLTAGSLFRGTLSANDTLDVFSIDLNESDGIALDFAGSGMQSPGVRLLNLAGQVIASGLDGFGLSHVVAAAGTYFLEVQANRLGGGLGEYAGVVNQFSEAQQHAGAGVDFVDASSWNFAGDESRIVGQLAGLGDTDVYRIQLDRPIRYAFTLSPDSDDLLSDQSRVMTLFNDAGQMIAYSTNGSLHSETTDANNLGTFYLGISATAEAGVGAYGIRMTENPAYSNQRDQAVQFLDFDQQMPTHLGFDWVSSFAVPEAIPFVIGVFNSRFSGYGVETVTTLPTTASELVTHGYGNFGDIGAGGFGGGNRGQRSSSGRAITSATQTSWPSLSYGSTMTLNHEYGHAVGLPHARLPNAFMSYIRTNPILPVGQGFSFQGTDSRRPGFSVRNERNYLDWSLQAGSQIPELEPNGFQSAQDLEPYFFEMTADLVRQQSVATEERPNLIRVGDFDGDQRNDIVVSNSSSNTIQAFLGDGSGGFQLANSVAVDAIGWWTEPIAVGDFNGDGRSDVASISYSQSSVSILTGQANGNLSAPTTIALGARPQSIAVGDVNGDSILDLVTANVNDQVRVLLGTGTGTFSAPTSFPVGDNPYSITLGDFDGDMRLDIATADSGGDTVSYLLGNGDGTFAPFQSMATSETPRGVTSADFNSDGLSDLAAIGRDGKTVTVFLADSSGRFAAPVEYPAHDDGQTISTGDINRDGVQDLLVGGHDVHFRALLGSPDGTFSRAISLVGGNSELAAVSGDFAGDGFEDLVIVNYFSNDFALYVSEPNDVTNDVAVVYGNIDSKADVDMFSIDVEAGQTFSFDVESAEFQYPLDSRLRILTTDGTELAENQDGLDRDSGLDSVDPFLFHTFEQAGTFLIEISSEFQSVGRYRLKVTPETAFEKMAPRVNAMIPDGGSSVNSTRELLFFLDDQIDPASITSANISVVGETSGNRFGTAYFDPLDSTLVWTASSDLPPDVYTVRLNGDVGGIVDLHGNLLDGEVAPDFSFPAVSGDGTAGGDFQAQFTITTPDTQPAALTSLQYRRDPYQRGRLTASFNDSLSARSVKNTDLHLRGAGPDSLHGTADDRILPLDINHDKLSSIGFTRLNLYTRGIPDPDLYRLEGTLQDAAGHTITIHEPINVGVSVPETALFQDAALSDPGLVGSYVNQSLRNVTSTADWRTSQTISGTRVDYAVDFNSNSFGVRADVGVTGGTDANWDQFSVQWDGWISIPVDGTRLQTRSDDGSRLWIDVNQDGVFAADGSELWDNGWGQGHGIQAGALTDPLPAGDYAIRVHYEEGTGGNAMILDWITPDLAGQEQGYGHGPAVVGMNFQANGVYQGMPENKVEVVFSGAIDPSTLTVENFQVVYSPDGDFFDGNDQVLDDADGTIAWNAVTRTATWERDSVLPVGYYQVLLNGRSDGIRSTAGQLLDGEFLSSFIPGNTNAPRWSAIPSGDGIPGGNHVAPFSISASALGLRANPAVISELNGQSEITLFRVSPESLGQPLQVQLTSEPPGRINVPSSVAIPAGRDSTTFTLNAIDNDLLQGSQTVRLIATAADFESGEVELTLLDHEQLGLSALTTEVSENGGTLRVTLLRPGTTGDLNVQLTNSNMAKLSAPSSLTIPDGRSSISFDVTGIDNSLLDGPQTALLTASAAGMLDSQIELTVLDHETLTLNVVETVLPENGGATTGTVARTDSSEDLLVTLVSSATDEATLPASILIPAGQLVSAPFAIQAVPDGVGDGRQTVEISASAIGYVGDARDIEVLDAEALELVLAAGSISENGGTTTGRIRRLVSQGAIDVQLTSDLANAVDIPASIRLEDGQLESAPFTIAAIDNNVLDGTRQLRLHAQADNYWPGSTAFQVLDYESLVVSLVGSAEISENGGAADVVVRRVDASGDLQIALSNDDPSELAHPAEITIPDGSLESAPIVLSAVDDNLLDGRQFVQLTAAGFGYVSDTVQVIVTDQEELAISVAAERISENGGQTRIRLERLNTNLELPLTVQVAVSDGSELDAPTEVTFGAFQPSVEFDVQALDDALLDGDQPVTVTVSAEAYVSVQQVVTVTDHEALRLEISDSSISERDGATTATVFRPAADSEPLTVQLTSSDLTEATVPASVIIPAGQMFATFPVQAVDDALLDGNESVQLTAEANAFVAATAELLVTDHEALSIQLEQNAIAERDGLTRATVFRPGNNLEQSVAIALSSNPEGGVILPPAVTIPAGQSEASFNVRAVFDPAITGTREVVIQASHGLFAAGQVTLQLLEEAPLVFELSLNSISELDGVTTARVTRPSGSHQDHVRVSLSASDPSQLDLPSRVSIPAGQEWVEFEVRSIDNQLLDGSRTVDITASASGFSDSLATLQVLDYESVVWQLTSNSIAENAGTVSVALTRSNSDIDADLSVLLSSEDPNQIDVPAQVVIPAGQAEVSFEIQVVDDQIVDGNSNVRLTATALGYQPDEVVLEVTDNDFYSWTNQINRFDVNNDSAVSPIDALILINELNKNGTQSLPTPTSDPELYYDVSEDDFLTPLDALMVINHLNNAGSGEGEKAWMDRPLVVAGGPYRKVSTGWSLDELDDEKRLRQLALDDYFGQY